MPERTLELCFRNDESNLVTVRVPNPQEDVTAEQISTVMDTVVFGK